MVRSKAHKDQKFGLSLCVISDTHLYKPRLPAADILIHCGDLTNKGNLTEMTLMNEWLSDIKSNYKKGILYCPGNHDWLPAKNLTTAEIILSAVTLLHDKEVIIEDCVFYSTSWQPKFMNWAFNLNSEALTEMYDKIPYYTDVLITHCPPFGILDKSHPSSEHLGSKELSVAIERVKPRLSCFGHIHGSYGIASIEGTTYVNAATCDESYSPTHHPILLDI